MLIIGICYLVASATDTRGNLVSQYNTVVTEWTNSERAYFDALNFTRTSGGTSTYATSTEPDPGTESWSQDAANGEGLESYTPLKYTTSESPYTTFSQYDCDGCTPSSQSMGSSTASPTHLVNHFPTPSHPCSSS